MTCVNGARYDNRIVGLGQTIQFSGGGIKDCTETSDFAFVRVLYGHETVFAGRSLRSGKRNIAGKRDLIVFVVDSLNLEGGMGSVESTIGRTCRRILVYVHRKTYHHLGGVVYGKHIGRGRSCGYIGKYTSAVTKRHTTYVPLCGFERRLNIVHDCIHHRTGVTSAETDGLFGYAHINIRILGGQHKVFINRRVCVRGGYTLLRHTKAAANTDTRTKTRFIRRQFCLFDFLQKRRSLNVEFIVVPGENVLHKYFLDVD